MDIYNILVKTPLIFTNQYFLLAFVTISFHFYDKYSTVRSVYLLFFSMILNKFLKLYFEIPLSPHLANSENYAFPSGHMQNACIFWLYFCWQTDSKFVKFLSLILCASIGFSLVYLGYHNYIDILGGFGVSVISIYFLEKLMYSSFFAKKEYSLPIYFLLIASTILYFIPKSYPELWGCIGGYCGFAVGFYARSLKKLDEVYWEFPIPWKFSIIILFIGGMSVYSTISMVEFIPFMKKGAGLFLKSFWVGYWLSCGVDEYTNKLILKIKEQQQSNQQKR